MGLLLEGDSVGLGVGVDGRCVLPDIAVVLVVLVRVRVLGLGLLAAALQNSEVYCSSLGTNHPVVVVVHLAAVYRASPHHLLTFPGPYFYPLGYRTPDVPDRLHYVSIAPVRALPDPLPSSRHLLHVYHAALVAFQLRNPASALKHLAFRLGQQLASFSFDSLGLVNLLNF